MAEVTGTEINANGGAEEQPQVPGFASAISRGLMMYMFMTIAQRFAIQKGIIPDPNPSSNAQHQHQQQHGGYGDKNAVMKPKGASTFHGALGKPSCIWDSSAVLDLHVYIADSDEMEPLKDCDPLSGTRSQSIFSEWHERDLTLEPSGQKSNARAQNITLTIPERVQFNETQIYAHVCLMKKQDDSSLESVDTSKILNAEDVHYQVVPLTKHKKRKRIRDEKNLLANNSSSFAEEEAKHQITENSSPLTIASANTKEDATLLYLKPSLTLQLVDISGMPDFPERKKIPLPILSHMHWLNDSSSLYFPIIYSSEFWVANKALVEVNDTLTESEIQLNFENIKVWKWQMMSQMEETWRKQADMSGGEDDAGSDMLRTMLLETNPILLAITGIVSVLHTVFDMLAFKSDIKFFKNKKSMVGISLRSMIVNVLSQLVILLYLMDNDTSYMVLMSNGMGVVIEIWKISKAVQVSLFDTDGKVSFSWTESKTYSESKTKEYDEIATDHLMFVTMPLVLGYGIYSLNYQKHKGWYSWILNTLVGFIYMFGFVMMTPQLFINYKLQSVAHLNWRTLTYKSINTFIDDLFAFVIKMPIMHRLACLRDDVIFFVFCYQRYKYRTDFSRVNEFGQCEEPTSEMLEESKPAEIQIEEERDDNIRVDAAVVNMTRIEDKVEGSGKEATRSDNLDDNANSTTARGTGEVKSRRGARDKK